MDDEVVVLPCGCVITTVFATKTIKIAPCRLDCRFLQAAVDLAKQGGKPVDYKLAP